MKHIDWKNQLLNFIGVILGVLLAFYISSYAEQRKEEKALEEMVASLIKDIEEDHRIYTQDQIPANEEQVETINQLLESMMNPELDTLQLSVNFDVNNYSPVSSTYLSMKSSGGLNLIHDIEVRRALSNYYDLLAEESVSKGELQANYLLNEIIPWLIEHTEMLDFNSEELMGDKVFANKLIIYNGLIGQKIEHYHHIVETSTRLKAQLELLIQ